MQHSYAITMIAVLAFLAGALSALLGVGCCVAREMLSGRLVMLHRRADPLAQDPPPAEEFNERFWK